MGDAVTTSDLARAREGRNGGVVGNTTALHQARGQVPCKLKSVGATNARRVSLVGPAHQPPFQHAAFHQHPGRRHPGRRPPTLAARPLPCWPGHVAACRLARRPDKRSSLRPDASCGRCCGAQHACAFAAAARGFHQSACARVLQLGSLAKRGRERARTHTSALNAQYRL